MFRQSLKFIFKPFLHLQIVIPPENTLHGCVMDSPNSCFDLNAVCNVDLSTGDCQWTDCI